MLAATWTLSGVTATPSVDATACKAANCAMPVVLPASGSTAPFQARRDLPEHPKPFSGNAIFDVGKSGDVAVRPREARNMTGADRVGDLHEHDRQAARRLHQRFHRLGAVVPLATTISAGSAISSAACRRICSGCAPERYSIRMLRPLV